MTYIILLNWNQWKLTEQCLTSIFKSSYSSFQVVLVDNASGIEHHQEMLSHFYRIAFISNPFNYGFGKGNNPGIKYAIENGADYIWLLNNDTIIEENTLSELVSFIESNPNLGIVGSVINNLPDKNTLQLYGGLKLNIPRCYVLPCKYGETPDYISGASIFIRTQAIKDAGLFDEKFFMYWEDVDLNLRIKQKGWQIGVAENSIVYHMNGVSSSSLKQEYYSFVSGIYFSWKYSKCFLFTLLVGFLLDRIIRRYPLLLINSLLASYRKWREKKDQ